MKDKGRNDNMKIGIANDHSAVDMKNEVVDYLKSLGTRSGELWNGFV